MRFAFSQDNHLPIELCSPIDLDIGSKNVVAVTSLMDLLSLQVFDNVVIIEATKLFCLVCETLTKDL